MNLEYVGEFKFLRRIHMPKGAYRAYFKCDLCGKEYVYQGKGRKQFLKRMRAKGCRVIKEKYYCGKCARIFCYKG